MHVVVRVVCQSQCQLVIMCRTFARAHAWVVRIIECLRRCIARRAEPVLSRELHHTVNIYCYYLTVSYMSSAAVVKRWCFSVTAKPRSLKLCMIITTFLELYINQVT